MKRLLVRIGIGLLGLAVVLFLGRNFIARKSVEVGVKKVTGFPLEIGSVNVGLFKSQLDVRDLKMMNPSGFEEKMFVDLPSLHLDYRLGSMLARAPHINEMTIDLKQLVIVKNAKGDSNVSRLKGATSGGAAEKSPAGKTPYRVDVLRIHVGTVTVKDYSRGKLSERNLLLNINATYRDITDSSDISRLVLLTVMSQAHLPDIGIKMDDLKKGLGNVQNVVGEAGKGLFDSLKKVIPAR